VTGADAIPSGRGRPPPGGRGRRRVVLTAAGVAVVIATFAFLLPRIADYGDVWGVVSELSWEWSAALAAVTVLNVVTFAPPWQVALPGLRFRAALAMTMAATALAMVVPGGAAAGVAGSYAFLRGLRFAAGDVARAVTLVSLWNQLANFVYPIVAVFLLTAAGGDSPLLATAAFVGVGALGVVVGALAAVLASDRLATEIGDLAARGASWARRALRRGPVAWGGASFERFRVGAVDLLHRRWHVLTAATFLGSLSNFLVLLVALRALGVTAGEVSAVEAFAGWALARLVGSIPITPGGVGVVELGLTAALVGFGGSNAGVVAAVLVYRFLAMVPIIALGLVTSLTWRRLRDEAAAGARPAPPG
jgi:putative heme transporter